MPDNIEIITRFGHAFRAGDRLEQAVLQRNPRERLEMQAPVGFFGNHERVERHVGEEFHQPRSREDKGNTVVEGVRQLVDGEHVAQV